MHIDKQLYGSHPQFRVFFLDPFLQVNTWGPIMLPLQAVNCVLIPGRFHNVNIVWYSTMYQLLEDEMNAKQAVSIYQPFMISKSKFEV